jgi:hypothetical protein
MTKSILDPFSKHAGNYFLWEKLLAGWFWVVGFGDSLRGRRESVKN